jgi:hypothetical protein
MPIDNQMYENHRRGHIINGQNVEADQGMSNGITKRDLESGLGTP